MATHGISENDIDAALPKAANWKASGVDKIHIEIF